MVFGVSLPSGAQRNGGNIPLMASLQAPPPLPADIAVPTTEPNASGINPNTPDTGIPPGRQSGAFSLDGIAPIVPTVIDPADSLARLQYIPPTGRFLPSDMYAGDSLKRPDLTIPPDTMLRDSVALPLDVAPGKRQTKNFLEDKISGRNTDSLVYDLLNNKVYMFGQGDITYQNMNLKADYMDVNLENKTVYGFGIMDTVTNMPTRPEFLDRDKSYTMDTITYNLETGKAKIKGVATKEGEGFLVAKVVKKMPDNTMNMAGGKYTTCDYIANPHWYFQMTKAKVIPKKKIIAGPTYFVMEDVPIPFLGIPFGFFPVSTGRNSGFIMPSYGEESVKGFFLRDGGYYFAFNDYIDATLTGGIYTLGSWEAKVQTRYIKRYKFSGSLVANYSKVRYGEKGSADYVNSPTFSLQWTHRQDAKFRPNSSFSASVNFSSSGYNRYGSNTMNDYLNTQTNSSIAYSKSWPGKPYSFSTNMQHSQNSADSTISISFPNVVFNVSRIYPFKRKYMSGGKEKWYEKISVSYSGSLSNRVTNIKQDDLLKGNILDKMSSGARHSIPVSTSFSLFNYLNFTPSATYNEQWAFRKVDREWSAEENRVKMDTTYGFYRQYNFGVSGSFNTKIYGDYQFTGKDPIVKAIRHMLTPSVSFSYAPDFRDPRFGFAKSYQSDSTGTVSSYYPTQGAIFFATPSGPSASIGFSLAQTLEMKVRSKSDTTGVKKVKLIDNFSLSGNYNFLAESFKLSTIGWSIRSTIFKGFGLNVSGSIDPYQIDSEGRRIDRLMWKDGKIGRITSAQTSFGYSFNSGTGTQPAVNDTHSGTPEENFPVNNGFFDNKGYELDPATRRALLTSRYYDFSIPWNLSFDYYIQYQNTGLRKNITQTLGFNGSVTLTPKWGVSFSSGYDFEDKKLTPTTFSINRDLHCWQMSFSWVPSGFRKSWSFNIHIKSSVLRDVKYDRSSSYYDNLLY